MKLKFSYIAYVVIAAALVIGVSRAYALIAPIAPAPSQSEIYTPINNSGESQTKKGPLISQEGFGSGTPLWFNGTNYQTDGSVGRTGSRVDYFPEDSFKDLSTLMRDPLNSIFTPTSTLITARALVSPWGFFTRVISSSLIIGGTNTVSDLPSVVPPSEDATAVKINLIGRGTASNSIEGTQAISIYTGNQCSTYTTIRVPGSELSFVRSSGNNFEGADIIARQVRLTDGNPKPNSVLMGTVVSSGGTLTSVWGTPQVVNGQIQLVPNP